MSKMINAKIKVFDADTKHKLQDDVNKFLTKIDIRQVIKTEFSTNYNKYTNIYIITIYYVEYADLRSAKLDNILS